MSEEAAGIETTTQTPEGTPVRRRILRLYSRWRRKHRHGSPLVR